MATLRRRTFSVEEFRRRSGLCVYSLCWIRRLKASLERHMPAFVRGRRVVHLGAESAAGLREEAARAAPPDRLSAATGAARAWRDGAARTAVPASPRGVQTDTPPCCLPQWL